MFAFPYQAGVIAVIVGWIFFRIVANKNARQFSWKREVVQLRFLINLLVIYRITFHPFAKIDVFAGYAGRISKHQRKE